MCLLEWDDKAGEPTFRTTVYRGKEDAFQATVAIAYHVQSLVRDKAPRRLRENVGQAVDVWAIEHAFGANRSVDFKLGRVQGAIVAALSSCVGDLIVNEVGPPEWKKSVGLSGNAKKADYVPELRERIRALAPSSADQVTEHEIDAFGIALHWRQLNVAAALKAESA